MRTSTPRFIAVQSLHRLHADGTRTPVVARLGEPVALEDGRWACPAELEGVDARYPDVFGDSSMQALALALGLVSTRLGHLLERGERLVDDAGDAWTAERLRAVFGPPTAAP